MFALKPTTFRLENGRTFRAYIADIQLLVCRTNGLESRFLKDDRYFTLLFTRVAPKKIFPDSTVNVFREELIALKLKIAPEMGYRVYDEFEAVEKLEDGSFIVEMSHPAGEWLVPYIASFGEYCEILAPERERDIIKKTLGNMLNKYL